jgi:hypothetical protein
MKFNPLPKMLRLRTGVFSDYLVCQSWHVPIFKQIIVANTRLIDDLRALI